MNGIRLTIGAGDFAVVSQTLVDLGISFNVEPAAERPVVAGHPARAPIVQQKRATKAGKVPSPAKAGRGGQQTRGSEGPLAGADRLREAIIRSQAPMPAPSVQTPAPAPEE